MQRMCQSAGQIADWPETRRDFMTPNDLDPKKLHALTSRTKQDERLRQLRALLEKQNRFPNDQFPKSNYLAAAIKDLLPAGPNTPPQTIEIDAGAMGRYRVTFVARQNPGQRTSAWFWGVDCGERIPERRGRRRG
jgi:hypothetical protein